MPEKSLSDRLSHQSSGGQTPEIETSSVSQVTLRTYNPVPYQLHSPQPRRPNPCRYDDGRSCTGGSSTFDAAAHPSTEVADTQSSQSPTSKGLDEVHTCKSSAVKTIDTIAAHYRQQYGVAFASPKIPRGTIDGLESAAGELKAERDAAVLVEGVAFQYFQYPDKRQEMPLGHAKEGSPDSMANVLTQARYDRLGACSLDDPLLDFFCVLDVDILAAAIETTIPLQDQI